MARDVQPLLAIPYLRHIINRQDRRMKHLPRMIVALGALVLLSSASIAATATSTRASFAPIPMTAKQWQPTGNTEFVSDDKGGVLRINDGQAILNGITLHDGTIAFDFKPIGEDMPGIRFHRGTDGRAEAFYIRVQDNCAQAADCLQYAPAGPGGIMQWDFYPENQAPAPINPGGWNRIRIVVSGQRMVAFINDRLVPGFPEGPLEGDPGQDGIALVGPAAFRKLRVMPGMVEGIAGDLAPDAMASDPHMTGNWRVSPPVVASFEGWPSIADMPRDGWQPALVGRHAKVNLAQMFGSPGPHGASARAWLKTRLWADADCSAGVSFSYLREAEVFVDGQVAFKGRNYYYPAFMRARPDGALSLQNGHFTMMLHRGWNDIAVALSNTFPGSSAHYGWGMQMRFDDITHIRVDSDTRP